MLRIKGFVDDVALLYPDNPLVQTVQVVFLHGNLHCSLFL